MKYIIVVFLLILVTTIKPKYLGILKFISLEKYLSSSNTKLIQYSLIFAFLLWIIYTLFKKEIISSLTSIQEGMENDDDVISTPDTATARFINECEIDNERDSELPQEEKVLQADKYINCAQAFNRKENSFYNMDKSLEYYEAALNIKLDTVSETQKDQVAEIYSAMSAIYSDKQVSAGCVTTNEDGEQVRDEEKCAIADEFGREAERLRTEALKYTMGDINNTLASSPEVDSRGIADESIVAGLTVDNVTPRPIYYEPGTVNYGGLGYKPSDVDIAYYNNYKSTPKNLLESDENSHNFGFCKQQDNIMVNIDDKCNKLSKDVCATTECCILMGGEKCVNGNAQGPKNRITYSDTSIKNKDFYYYQGKCYGNCT